MGKCPDPKTGAAIMFVLWLSNSGKAGPVDYTIDFNIPWKIAGNGNWKGWLLKR